MKKVIFMASAIVLSSLVLTSCGSTAIDDEIKEILNTCSTDYEAHQLITSNMKFKDNDVCFKVSDDYYFCERNNDGITHDLAYRGYVQTNFDSYSYINGKLTTNYYKNNKRQTDSMNGSIYMSDKTYADLSYFHYGQTTNIYGYASQSIASLDALTNILSYKTTLKDYIYNLDEDTLNDVYGIGSYMYVKYDIKFENLNTFFSLFNYSVDWTGETWDTENLYITISLNKDFEIHKIKLEFEFRGENKYEFTSTLSLTVTDPLDDITLEGYTESCQSQFDSMLNNMKEW